LGRVEGGIFIYAMMMRVVVAAGRGLSMLILMVTHSGIGDI